MFDNNCRLLCHLLLILKVIFANNVDPDQTAPLDTVCLYTKIDLKSLQEYSADDINRRHFQMQVFLAFYGLKSYEDDQWVIRKDAVQRNAVES